MLSITIPGAPIGKGRPRFARAGAFIRTYTPDKTRLEEAFIRMVFNEKYPGHVPTGRGVTMAVRAYFPIPKSTSKKLAVRMGAEDVPFLHKSDADNILKICMDSLNGMAYEDDRLIYRAEVWKYYSLRPRLEIDIREQDDLTEIKVA